MIKDNWKVSTHVVVDWISRETVTLLTLEERMHRRDLVTGMKTQRLGEIQILQMKSIGWRVK